MALFIEWFVDCCIDVVVDRVIACCVVCFFFVDCFVGCVASGCFDCALVGFVGRCVGCSFVDYCLNSVVVCSFFCSVGCYARVFI